MPRTSQDEAVVLRTYNVGETDRFLVLLTRDHGKIVARAQGVRRMTSRRAGGLLPLHRISVVFEERSFGFSIVSSTCLQSHQDAWRDPGAFCTAQEGIELVLRLLDDAMPVTDVYDLLLAFLAVSDARRSSLLLPAFTVQLLDVLGLCPSFTHSCVSHRPLTDDIVVFSPSRGGFCCYNEESHGCHVTSSGVSLLRLLGSTEFSCLPAELPEAANILSIVQGLLSIQLGGKLLSPSVSAAISSGSMPTCQYSGRAS